MTSKIISKHFWLTQTQGLLIGHDIASKKRRKGGLQEKKVGQKKGKLSGEIRRTAVAAPIFQVNSF